MPLLEVKIPSMGESITSGVLVTWHVANGSQVKKDQPLFELETDKITTEGTAEAAGTISFKVEAGTEVKIGQVVATIDPSGAGAPAATTPVGAAASAKAGPAANESLAAAGGNDLPLSPAVRRLAEETGVDLASVAGTGKDGRVTKGDMLAAGEKPAGAPAATAKAGSESVAASSAVPTAAAGGTGRTAPKPATAGEGGAVTPGERQTRRKLSPLRQRIAQRLVAAQHEAAMLTTFNEADMSAVMALRSRYQEDFQKRNGIKLGFMSFFVKAVVQALIEVPAVNARIDGDSVIENHYYDIGVAVSTERGLMVPVVRNCDRLNLAGVEKAIAEAATKAREGKITLDDLEGGVFTITNGGIFGSMLSTPILNPPQSGILGLHAITERPMAVKGQVVIRPMMYLALSYDHRLVDGREAVTFLVKVKQAIEDPSRILVGL